MTIFDGIRDEASLTGGQLEVRRGRISSWIKLLRPHQWAKNTLVLIAPIAGHVFSMAAAERALLAFVAFSLCASAVYVINDLVDIEADRPHPSKRNRPFASGALSPRTGFITAPLLAAASFVVAFHISAAFAGILGAYLAITTAYSFYLKRKVLVDIITLAALYTVRMFAGAVAVGVILSPWLLGFSMFLFIALGFVKRISELGMYADKGVVQVPNRGYQSSDLLVLLAFAAASGYSAVIVFSLYLSSTAVSALYHHPDWLWAAGPVLIYWISRMLLLSYRRMVDDDPVIFALRDPVSIVSLVLVSAIMAAAAL